MEDDLGAAPVELPRFSWSGTTSTDAEDSPATRSLTTAVSVVNHQARMPNLIITTRPADDQFARVDLVKQYVGQEVLEGDDLTWILGTPLVVEVDDGEVITVPVGFTTDGASIPPFAQKLTGWKPFEGPQRWAGIVHDWLYYQDGYGRRRADEIFRDILRTEGASAFRTTVMYWAVRLFSGTAYRRNQERDVEDRIWGNPSYPRHA